MAMALPIALTWVEMVNDEAEAAGVSLHGWTGNALIVGSSLGGKVGPVPRGNQPVMVGVGLAVLVSVSVDRLRRG